MAGGPIGGVGGIGRPAAPAGGGRQIFAGSIWTIVGIAGNDRTFTVPPAAWDTPALDADFSRYFLLMPRPFRLKRMSWLARTNEMVDPERFDLQVSIWDEGAQDYDSTLLDCGNSTWDPRVNAGTAIDYVVPPHGYIELYLYMIPRDLAADREVQGVFDIEVEFL